MADNKPLKRSEQLAPLSREHYEGLSFVMKIRKGLQKNVSAELISDFIHWFWQNHLEAHFEDEERKLLPRLPGNDEMGNRMAREHKAIRNLVDRENITTSDTHLLAQLLYDHIRFEERQLFPYIEEKLPLNDLNEIFEGLHKEHKCLTEWKNEFWKD